MGCSVYILRSEKSGRYYCGISSDVQGRVRQHNDPAYTLTRTTKRFEGPWLLVWSKRFASRSDAMKEERSIKKRGIERYLKEVQSAESRLGRD
jgi:putative endonuclease